MCVAVTTLGNRESDLGAQFSSYQKAACRVINGECPLRMPVRVLIGDNCSHIEIKIKASQLLYIGFTTGLKVDVPLLSLCHTNPLGGVGWSSKKALFP